MGKRVLITLGTDGVSDWVQTPDGVKHMLGAVSVLKLVTELVSGTHGMRQTIDAFNKHGQAMVTVDLDAMWALLKPHRARWTSVRALASKSLMPEPNRNLLTIADKQGATMADDADKIIKDSISNQIARIEAHIDVIQTSAKEAAPGSITSGMMKDEISRLKDLVSFLRRPSVYGDQSSNSSYYGLPEKLPDGSSARSKQATLEQHTKVAHQILAAVSQTEEKVDQLVLAGKSSKFNVGAVKSDLQRLAKNIHIIAGHPKFKEAGPEVTTALTELSKQARHIHGLFAQARV